jgi:arabinose-5-phosphate isomerase
VMLVSHVMLPLDKFPVLKHDEIVKACLDQMSYYHLGIACIVDNSGILLGVFTDGDLRRKLLNSQKPLASFFVDDVLDHGTRNPFKITDSDSLAAAIELMELHQVWDLPVVDSSSSLVGLLHLHPAVKALLPSHLT